MQLRLLFSLVWALLSIPMIVIASQNMRNCPADQTIPIRLGACGILAIVGFLVNVVGAIASCSRDDETWKSNVEKFSGWVFYLVKISCVVVMLTMAAAVLKEFQPVYASCQYEETTCSPRVCDKTLYFTAFGYAAVAIAALVFVFAYALYLFCGRYGSKATG